MKIYSLIDSLIAGYIMIIPFFPHFHPLFRTSQMTMESPAYLHLTCLVPGVQLSRHSCRGGTIYYMVITATSYSWAHE